MHDIQDYVTAEGKDPFKDWIASLADRMARARLLARVHGWPPETSGTASPLRCVWELKDHGPGYRVYYARPGSRLILLLIGGDKRRQKADIAAALYYLQDWQRRNK